MGRVKTANAKELKKVNIRPGVSVLSVLSHLNYRPWFALAEFVDNSLQSHLSQGDQIAALDNEDRRLKVYISIDASDGGRISIRDNAAGISQSDFARAFRPAELPPDRTGLCEFGMGMKSAACWFSSRWHVRTSAIGEDVERTIHFDVQQIVRDSIDELEVRSRKAPREAHFTEVVLTDLHRLPVGRTVGKIKSHLRDIYRIFTRENRMVLLVDGQPLTYEPPEILVAPCYKDPIGEPIEWRKEFDWDFGEDFHARGFAAIRKRASTSEAGFALFRRGRLIQGSSDEGYRPEYIFGRPNTFPYQRLFGEIHLDGFGVSHTKDGIQWSENEEPFLELLREELTKDEFPILQQAREYRVERSARDYRRGAERAIERTSASIRNHVPPIANALAKATPEKEPPCALPATASECSRRVIDVTFQNQDWRIVIELCADPSHGDWLELSEDVAENHAPESSQVGTVGMRLSLMHPFMQRFCGTECEEIEPILRIAAAIGLGEFVARQSGVKRAGVVRRNVNELLRDGLSQT